MRKPSNRDVAEKYLGFLEAGDLSGALSLVADDAVFWLPNTGDLDKPAFEHFFANVLPLIRTMEFTVLGATQEGERVAMEVAGHAVLTNDRIYTNHYHFLFIVRNGLLRLVKEYTDSAPAIKAFGP